MTKELSPLDWPFNTHYVHRMNSSISYKLRMDILRSWYLDAMSILDSQLAS